MGRSFYASSLTIPANTNWASPAKCVFVIPAGTIVEWHIHGAPEHQHQVSIAIYHVEHRVFPEGEGEYFYPGERPAIFVVETEMVAGITKLVVLGANTDDTYEHTVYVGVSIATEGFTDRLVTGLKTLFVPTDWGEG